jgi:PAS domain S-box-containing protein
LETLAKYVGLEEAEAELGRAYFALGIARDTLLNQDQFEKVVAFVERSLGRDVGEAMARAVITDKLVIKPEDVGRFYESFMRMRRSLIERQHKAEKLNETLARLKELHESVSWSVPMGLCSMDMEMKVTTWNQGMEKLTGVRAEQAAGTQALELLPSYTDLILKAISGKEPVRDNRHERTLPGGERRIESVVVSPLVDRFNVTRGLLLLAEDVSAHAMLEESAQRAEKLASVGSLAAGLAHEVGNPLASIFTLIQELSGPEGEDGKFRKESLGLISHHIGRIDHILKSLVDFTRLKSISMAPRPLPRIIADAVSLARLGRKGHSVEISVETPEGLPRAVCDADQIEQALLNLLFNAADASPAGGPVTVRAFASPPGYVTVTVEDRGTGMSEEAARLAFTPFFTTKPVGSGTGLGLFVCYNIIQSHGGSIWIDSAPGGGAKVSFSLRAGESEGYV